MNGAIGLLRGERKVENDCACCCKLVPMRLIGRVEYSIASTHPHPALVARFDITADEHQSGVALGVPMTC